VDCIVRQFLSFGLSLVLSNISQQDQVEGMVLDEQLYILKSILLMVSAVTCLEHQVLLVKVDIALYDWH
jgi:hypothetical protein